MDEWELSKENVQPLKSGRKVANLTAALQPTNNVDQRLHPSNVALETELRAYVGDDPIEPWDKYIRWTEQTFPRGGKESNMMVLLQRCVQQFKEETRYKNDPRYVNAWIKLAGNFSNDPLEMYQFMRDQGIGFQLAVFYEAWAWQLEQVGNTKKADFVYQEGINCKAEPHSRLEALHKEFQFRIARTTMEQMQEAEYDQPQANAPQRNALGGLKGRGKQQKVGTQRTGAAQKRSSGGLGLQVQPGQVGQQFAIFDENAAQSSTPVASALPAPTGEWENLAPQEQARKENEQSAGQWTGQRVRQPRTPSVGLDEVSRFSRPSFEVHVDEAPQPMMTPHKLPEMGNQVLSARKPAKQPDNTLKTMQKNAAMFTTASDDKTKVMYCKHLIYGGATEMSIEELRAIRVKAKKEERRLAAEREELKRKQELLQQQMLEKQAEFERRVQERLQEQQTKHEEEMKRFMEQQQQHVQQFQMRLMTGVQPMQQQQVAPPQVNSHMPPPQENIVPNQPLQVQGSSVMDDGSAFRVPTPQSATSRPQPLQQQVALPQVNAHIPPVQENGVPNQPSQMHGTSTMDDASTFRVPAPQSATRRLQSEQPVAAAAAVPTPQQPMDQMEGPSVSQPLRPKTPEEQHQRTVDKAQQQLQELRQEVQRYPLNESVCGGQGKDQMGNNQQDQDRDQTGTISCTQQLHFDETRTVNWQQFVAQADKPTPSFNYMKKPPPLASVAMNSSVVTPNASAVFNTSSNNTSQVKTPLDHSRPDSRQSSHSGRLHRFTPSRTPGGITAPSPTVNTKEALGAIMAMLNNPLHVDEGWVPTARDENMSGVAADNHKVDFAPDFAKEEPKPAASNCPFTIAEEPKAASNCPFTIAEEPKPAAKCPFTIAADDDDEYKHLDNQENQPPKDYVAPQPDPRPRSGILQPSVGVPVMPLESEQQDEVPMEQQHQLQQPEEEEKDEGMEGIEPIKDDENDHHQANATSYHESTIMHHSNHSAFEAAARMASTPFNPQFATERPSFSMSAIKAPMNSSLPPEPPIVLPTTTTDSVPTSAPFSIFADPGPQPAAVPMCSQPSVLQEHPKVPEPVISGGSENQVVVGGAARVEVSGMVESFDVNETTVNPPRQLSPIMETSAEGNPSSASSSNGSQAPSLAASQIQQQQQQMQQSAVTNNSLHTSAMMNTSKHNVSSHASSIVDKEHTNASQHTSFVSVRKSSSSSHGSVGESKYELDSDLHFNNDDLFCSTSIHDSKLGNLQAGQNVENVLANDMSSMMINDQSLHRSMLNTSAAAGAHHNQSLMNQSANRPPADYLSQSALENSLHKSRIEEHLHNFSIHQDMMNTTAASQHQNESIHNHSMAAPMEPSCIDPWNEELKQNLLASLQPPLIAYGGCEVVDSDLPKIGPDLAVGLGNELYSISEKVGKGAFAEIYSAYVLDADDFELDGGDKRVALKVEKPPCPWEFYISKQLQERTKKLGGMDVSKSLMDIENSYMYNDGTVLITELHSSGTLLDAINRCGRNGLKESGVIYFAIELIHVMEQMHASHIIHGDIKPDNILLTNIEDISIDPNPALSPDGYTKYVKLIDMGRSIDMSLFPDGTQFNVKSGTDGFDCIEMQTGTPWTYQTDLYGLAGTLFCMLCGTYMKTYKEGGRWKSTAKWKRFWKADWKSIFDKLLNIPSCQEIPSLASVRQDLETVFNTYYWGTEKFSEFMVSLAY